MELQQIDLGHGASGRERSGSATVQAASGSVNEHVSTPTMASSARRARRQRERPRGPRGRGADARLGRFAGGSWTPAALDFGHGPGQTGGDHADEVSVDDVLTRHAARSSGPPCTEVARASCHGSSSAGTSGLSAPAASHSRSRVRVGASVLKAKPETLAMDDGRASRPELAPRLLFAHSDSERMTGHDARCSSRPGARRAAIRALASCT
jgi:hypothetical protein